MLLPALLATLAAVPVLACGSHGNAGTNAPRALESRKAMRGSGTALETRQAGWNEPCGASAGWASCAEDLCCSEYGYCGAGKEYCAAPLCQIDFGPACDAWQWPGGDSTADVPRDNLGSIIYGGEGIHQCTVPGTIALTFDDGPYIYTDGILDLLQAYGAKATFFITGNNEGKGHIDDWDTPWPYVIQRTIDEGHQIASHTWSHQDLSVITSAQREDQIIKNEMAIRNVLGKFPTYIRPPYLSCSEDCANDLGRWGYHITYINLDTFDWANDSPELIENAKNNFGWAVNPSDPNNAEWLVLAHDIRENTGNLTEYMLDMITAKGFRAVTLGECLGDPEENWYRY